MPKVTFEIGIEHVGAAYPPFGGDVYLTNLEDFWEIVDLGFPEVQQVGYGKPGGRVEVKCSEDDVRIERMLAIIRKNGYMLSPSLAVGHGTNRFYARRRRTYSKTEIERAEFLRVYVGSIDCSIADWGYGGDDESGWVAKANTRANTKLVFGGFRGFGVLLFAEELKVTLQEIELHGLDFVAVKFDVPEKARRQLWQIAQNTKMPRCHLSRVTQGKEPFREGGADGAMWDEGGYAPVELQFHRKEVQAMGAFDVATTREKTGPNSQMMKTDVIVSQRFRHVMEKLKIKGVEYVPVRLLDN